MTMMVMSETGEEGEHDTTPLNEAGQSKASFMNVVHRKRSLLTIDGFPFVSPV